MTQSVYLQSFDQSRVNQPDILTTARGSMARQVTLIIAAVIEVAIIVLALELTLGFGYESEPGSMPAPAPIRGF